MFSLFTKCAQKKTTLSVCGNNYAVKCELINYIKVKK